MKTRGFTLIEILFAVSLMAVVFTLVLMSFSIAIRAWRKGMELSKDLQHGDYVAEQLVMALRSAYYPDGNTVGSTYGFQMEDNGDGPESSDKISWVKLGHALVGRACPFAESPHRVEFWVEPDKDGHWGADMRAYGLFGQPEDFQPEDVPPQRLSNRVIGFNCRTAYQEKEGEIDWLDQWEETNRIPTVVEITLYMEPLEEGEKPVEIKRVFGLPVAPLAWKNMPQAGEP